MKPIESLQEFYQSNPHISALIKQTGSESQQGHFNVFPRSYCNKYTAYQRRDFYKISLVIGTGNLFFADEKIEVNRNALIFFNAQDPYSWEPLTRDQSGYFCLFTEEFMAEHKRNKHGADSPLFSGKFYPVYFLDDDQTKRISSLFERMAEEMNSDYVFKYDVIHSFLDLLMHEALRMQPHQTRSVHANASSRIASHFIELLERQFPIDTPEHTLKLRTASDFASVLAVHTNHLNRAVREITGKTTTRHIADRVTKEAIVLLKHTDWSVADISSCLGFEYPSYFNIFFKKQTQFNTKSFRS